MSVCKSCSKEIFTRNTEVNGFSNAAILWIKERHMVKKEYERKYKEDKPVVVESIRKLIADGKYPEKLYG